MLVGIGARHRRPDAHRPSRGASHREADVDRLVCRDGDCHRTRLRYGACRRDIGQAHGVIARDLHDGPVPTSRNTPRCTDAPDRMDSRSLHMATRGWPLSSGRLIRIEPLWMTAQLTAKLTLTIWLATTVAVTECGCATVQFAGTLARAKCVAARTQLDGYAPVRGDLPAGAHINRIAGVHCCEILHRRNVCRRLSRSRVRFRSVPVAEVVHPGRAEAR